MYAYLNGIVAEVTEDTCIIEVNDIGYQVCISTQTASKLPSIGNKVRMYTYTWVREDAFLLYGFLSRKDLEFFKKCITVSGIGPKGALGLLSVMDADELRFAIIAQDVKAISKAPGIGKRTAERLILELKDKLDIQEALSDLGKGDAQIPAATTFTMDNPGKKEAVEALVALGYGQTESVKAVNAVDGADTMESGLLLKKALKHLL